MLFQKYSLPLPKRFQKHKIMEEQKVTEELNSKEERIESQTEAATSEESSEVQDTKEQTIQEEEPKASEEPQPEESQPEEPQPEEPKKYCPESNIVWAIVCTIMCCMPLGIVAIIKSLSVEKLWEQGRHDEAQKAADAAKKWAIAGAISGPIAMALLWGVYIIIEVLFLGMAFFFEISNLLDILEFFNIW